MQGRLGQGVEDASVAETGPGVVYNLDSDTTALANDTEVGTHTGSALDRVDAARSVWPCPEL